MLNSVKLEGKAVKLNGHFPVVGDKAIPFTLVDKYLADIPLSLFQNKIKILNIFPSVDTGICAASVRRFNQIASQINNCIVLCISADLPFAQARFCGAEGLDNVKMLSTLRGYEFKKNYGVEIADGPMAGLTCRAVIIIDEYDRVIYCEQVKEIKSEPDYESALKIVR